MIEYTIRMFDAQRGHMVVDYSRYGFKTIDVPLDTNGHFIIGNELDQFIRSQLTEDDITRQEKLKQGAGNANIIASLVVSAMPADVGITYNDVTHSTIPTSTNLDIDIKTL